ncbi:amylosucrase [Cellvibrio sp. PSBB023]|uniref:amylosucrase n=1 Tax=Cellvibrio sp. PSBB023 TaxID=1945512 RepID=UPI00098FF8C3|nr:amylosucrase [Cellvibrio sp. PSBB023]AQT62143.1 amylosucrase [Cellvibrio sp. PSBB023]
MNPSSESKRCLTRILHAIDLSSLSKTDHKLLLSRLDQHFPALFDLLLQVYDKHYDLHYHLQQLVKTLASQFAQRNARLKKKDKQRLADPLWHKSEQMLGMACYVDLIAGDLNGVREKIPYFTELGLTYLHLMPLYKSPEGDSDGGYAVSDYRCVNPVLGTTKDLQMLAQALNEAGISLVLDFVFNHTADDHAWAKAARAGDEKYQDYYLMFDDRQLPDQYDATLREIFPSVRRGSFSYLPDIQKWVWTTFNNFQWDLNYGNPAVFRAIVDEMLFLANLGCDSLRLDALAFIWKDLGTMCENRPKAHALIKAFNCCLQIVAPAVVFKSEAIVHPDEVVKYIAPNECQLSYNPLLMALLWNSLATQKTRLITQSLSHRFAINPQCTWVNYVRCHDDIGWTFDDGDAAHLGINGYNHRLFLNQFYTGRFENSFAVGLGFQENPENGDCRVCGSLASLAGLQQALERNSPSLIELAIKRMLLLNSVILSIGGIPLLYAGDELAMLNDYSFQTDPHKLHDARWVNRPRIDAQAIALAHQPGTPQYQVNVGLRKMIATRKKYPVFGAASTQVLRTGSDHCFAYLRQTDNGERLLVLCNFSDSERELSADILHHLLPAREVTDLIEHQSVMLDFSNLLRLTAYQVLWLYLPIAVN